MKRNAKYLIPMLCLVFAVQLSVPAWMIIDRESVIAEGREYKFEAAPLDPYDPFKGKYITLRYRENFISLPRDHFGEELPVRGDKIYLKIQEGQDGFAKVTGVSLSEEKGDGILEAEAGYVSHRKTSDSVRVSIDYPFRKFYMEESKAQEAEDLYRGSLSDSTVSVYSVVSVREGRAVLKDVMVNGKPISEVVLEERLKRLEQELPDAPADN